MTGSEPRSEAGGSEVPRCATPYPRRYEMRLHGAYWTVPKSQWAAALDAGPLEQVGAAGRHGFANMRAVGGRSPVVRYGGRPSLWLPLCVST